MAGAKRVPPPFPASRGTLRSGIDGSLPFVKDHARAAAFHMAHVTLQGVVDRVSSTPARLAVVSGQSCCLFDRTTRNLAPCRFNNNMSPLDSALMQPDIVRWCLVQRDHFLLPAVLPPHHPT